MTRRAFTIDYHRPMRVLLSEVYICLPIAQEADEHISALRSSKKYLAIWDTGATHSAITKKVANDLQLQSTGVREVKHAQGKSMTNTYLVGIILPDNVIVPQVPVTEVDLIPDDNTEDNKNPQILIGMDIIALGDFAVTNADNKTVLSFRVPSVERIDFIPDSKEHNIMSDGNRKQRRIFQAKKRKGMQ